jgi:hypothetical protein
MGSQIHSPGYISPGSKASDDGQDEYGDPLFPVPGVDSPQKKMSNKRNTGRLGRALKKDEHIMSKYYLHDGPMESFITTRVTGPDDHFEPP